MTLRARAACSAALLACVVAVPALAQPGGTRYASWPDVPAWWAAPGTWGWWPDHGYSAAPPRSFAGLVRGGWLPLEEEHARNAAPEPGVAATWLPIAWNDSVAVRTGGDAAWNGFGAPLVTVTAVPIGTTPQPEGPRHALSMFTAGRGSAAEEEDGVSVARVDSLLPLRVEAMGATRGATGALEKTGRHLWGGSVGLLRGNQRFTATLTQRSSAGALANGDDQAVTGLAGAGSWMLTHGASIWSVDAERGYHHAESFGESLAFSRRDAQQQTIGLGWRRAGDAGLQVRLALSRAAVDRSTFGVPVVNADEDQVWLAARDGVRLGPARLNVGVGGGWSRTLDRTVVAPSVELRVPWSGFDVRGVAERLVDPVWSDLAPGTPAFLQDTWAGGIDVNRSGNDWHADATWRSGRTSGRALASRLPLEELWLREGYARDPDLYTFRLLHAGAAFERPSFGGGVSGFVLARNAGPAQPLVDPANGARAYLEGGIRMFTGDLIGRVRVEGAWVGERESEAVPSRHLAGYATADVVASLTLADAVFTFRFMNLEDIRRPETWLDPRTGVEALGPGHEFRLTLSWILFD